MGAVIVEPELPEQMLLYLFHHNSKFAGVDFSVSISISVVNVALGLLLGPFKHGGYFSSIEEPIAVPIIFRQYCIHSSVTEVVGPCHLLS